MSDTFQPIQALTPDNQGAIVTITCFVSIFSLLSVTATRIWITWGQRLRLQNDDALFALAMVFAIAQSACMEKQANVGLGMHWGNVSSQDRVTFLALGYAAQIMGILAMGFAKTSVTMFYQHIASFGQNYHYHALFVMVGVWTVFAVFAQAFACGLPDPWLRLPSECSAQFPVDYAIISTNAITDVVLVSAFLPVIWKLNTSRRKRIIAMGLFALRLIVSGVAIGQLIVVINMPKDSDPSWAMVARTIMDQVVTYLSVITACLPRITRFLYDLQTGQMGPGISGRLLSSLQKPVKPSKSGSLSLSTSKPKVLTASNAESESSLIHLPNREQKHEHSRDTSADVSATTTDPEPGPAPPQLRPSSEVINQYNTRCFSDGNTWDGGDAAFRQHRGQEDESASTSSLRNKVMYKTSKFKIDFGIDNDNADSHV